MLVAHTGADSPPADSKVRCTHLESVTLCVFLFGFFWFFVSRAELKNGVPAHVRDPASPHYSGDAVHCHHGEGRESYLGHGLVLSQCVNVLLCVTRLISHSSPGGSGRAWRTLTCGTTVGLTTSRERGCAHPPKKPVRFHRLIFILNGSKSGG